ncbi:MAG: adenylate/guanylate cyclase domain-containing protein, partial [Alphaproteobacteria bacterium]|nr:adenylate/guanylate cyclase domain-containing protein [Alphaproteobacteria bacterium]
QSWTSAHDAALLAEMLSLANDGRYPAADLAPEQRRHKTLEALVSQTEALARHNPVLMIFEDAHWIDPTSLEVFGRVVDRVRTCRVLLLLTFRPEFEAPWIGQPHVTTLIINRLTQRDVGAMIGRVLGNKLIPATIRQDIIERTDGIPLFVEEMTKAVLEAQGEGAAEHTVAAIPSPALGVPASLHASLLARLDRLGAAREVAQIGAAIGREFSHALLAAVASKPEAELGSALDRLTNAGLLFRQGVAPQATYLFKHALVQDAAYGTLLREPRRALHARIAALLERQFAALVEDAPEVLGRHHADSGNAAAAVQKFLEAGTRANARSSNKEAVAHLLRASDLLRQLPATPDRDVLELRVVTGLSSARYSSDGYAAPQTMAAYAAERELAERIGDRRAQFRTMFHLYSSHYIGAKHAQALEYTDKCLRLADEHGSEAWRCVAHRSQAAVLNAAGRFVEAQGHAATAKSLYRRELHAPYAIEFPHDIGVAALAHYALATWHLGYPQQAGEAVLQTIELAASVKHANTETFSYFFPTGLIAAIARDMPELDRATRKLGELSQLHGLPQWSALSTVLRGCFLAYGDDASNAIENIENGLLACRRLGFEVYRPLFLGYLARAQLRVGDDKGAARTALGALRLADDTGERADEAELLRLLGRITVNHSPAEGERYFLRAIELARRQHARLLEMRAITSLARLWREQGKRDNARNLAAPVYNWFIEGFETPDLKEAKALLDEL